MERESMEYDVVVVGAGPAGLATAIRLKQLAEDAEREINVCVVEKGAEVGAHILSGNVLEPRALNELIPDWKDKGAPVKTGVSAEKFLFLNEKKSLSWPTWLLIPQQKNHGNYIISLANLCRWLGEQAEAAGIEVYPGFPAADVIFDDNGAVAGVLTGDFGVARDGEHKDGYMPGMELRAKYTVFAEGCRGHLGKRLQEKFELRKDADPQQYSIGLKEIWEIDPAKHQEGLVVHTAGWPLDNSTYGGSFLYHAEDNQVYLGFVIGLGYENPYLSPFDEFQRWKTHPAIRKTLEGGKRIAYGSRALTVGGAQSLPRMSFPGGVLVGCEAGTLNTPKIKGTHTAMKSGMIAAETIFAKLGEEGAPGGADLTAYEEAFRKSWAYKELHVARNAKPAFNWGNLAGILFTGIDQILFRGHMPLTLRYKKADHEKLKPAKECRKIDYPKPDGEFSFDKLSSVFISNTNHEEDQPVHLQLKDPSIPIEHNLPVYDEPAQRYCPAAVYEVVRDDDGSNPRFVINAQNCVHCKTCDIKDPAQNINWVTPEGGGGPTYPNM